MAGLSLYGIKKRRWLLLLFLLLLICCGSLGGEVDGDALLKKSDDTFFMNEAKFSFHMEDYEHGVYKRYYLFDGYVKGVDRYLLVGKEPAVLRGMSHLRVEDVIYEYIKRVDRMKQVSAKVAFYNSLLTMEDVLNSKLATYYDLKEWEKSYFEGEEYYILRLQAKTKMVAYYRINIFIRPDNFLPVKREYFSYSGQKIKEMIFEEIHLNQAGKTELIKFTMYDSLREGHYTKVTISEIEYKPIPDLYFQRSYLKAITP